MLRLTFTKALPTQVPAQLTVYRFQRPRVDRNKLLQLAQKVWPREARTAPKFYEEGNWIVADWGMVNAAMNSRSGSIRLRHERSYLSSRPSWNISDARAVEIARAFVTKTKILGNVETNLKLGKVTHLRGQTFTRGEGNPEFILDAGVLFTREVDSIPVVGQGGQLMVNLDSTEAIVGGSRIWRDIAGAAGKTKIKPPDYAVAELQKRLKQRELQGNVRVMKADFCYFEAGTNDWQEYLEPSYAFVFETSSGKYPYKSAEVISAAEKPKQLWPQRKRFST